MSGYDGGYVLGYSKFLLAGGYISLKNNNMHCLLYVREGSSSAERTLFLFLSDSGGKQDLRQVYNDGISHHLMIAYTLSSGLSSFPSDPWINDITWGINSKRVIERCRSSDSLE
mmetsp:Transcript_3704/g.9410  ORF Transcript_3704/g.9410 Transcript_3704/m.9410 type:complete len:114 (+) Transcript_3704:267-608(+)